MRRDAILSKDGLYRWQLMRQWRSRGKGFVCWIMLNPSMADARIDDPTARRVVTFSKQWGFDGLYVVNLFSFRTPQPDVLKQVDAPIGEETYHWIQHTTMRSARVVCAWGNGGALMNRGWAVGKQLDHEGVPLWCLAQNLSGHPKHPLYVAADKELEEFDVSRLRTG